jgi:hypothetical protein
LIVIFRSGDSKHLLMSFHSLTSDSEISLAMPMPAELFADFPIKRIAAIAAKVCSGEISRKLREPHAQRV